MPDKEPPRSARLSPPDDATPPCDICGSAHTAWIKCKLICLDCRSIVMSCGDL